ncbi:MAG: trans-aconitate 2-methyltransferase [Pseudonocardiales bacterium]|jgi:trans-aconitate 2-methyltransferase|nr:trans-aconitate 2-methyltransferase [Pseudonocardiales bacterium]
MTREWDASSYDSLPLPHTGWGRRTLARLPLAGTESVLDAGAGTGRDTLELLDRLPHGRVLAVDGSKKMLERLAAKLDADDPRLEILQADLTQDIGQAKELDAVFSVATFHWIADHDALFANMARLLRPGGFFVAECGGEGNVARIDRAVQDVLGTRPDTVWNFAGIDDTRRRLERAGFVDVEVALRPDPARLQPGHQFESYLATVVLGGHLDRMADSDRAPFVRAVAERIPEAVVDYVRLEFRATKACSPADQARV